MDKEEKCVAGWITFASFKGGDNRFTVSISCVIVAISRSGPWDGAPDYFGMDYYNSLRPLLPLGPPPTFPHPYPRSSSWPVFNVNALMVMVSSGH